MRIATTQLWVHDQEEALAFYTQKLGFEVRMDATLPEMGDFRWLTVGPAGQPEIDIVLMAIPGPPVLETDTVAQVQALMAKGLAGTVFLATDDCQADYETLSGRGRRVRRDARGAALRHRRRLPRPVGQPSAAHPAQGVRLGLTGRPTRAGHRPLGTLGAWRASGTTRDRRP